MITQFNLHNIAGKGAFLSETAIACLVGLSGRVVFKKGANSTHKNTVIHQQITKSPKMCVIIIGMSFTCLPPAPSGPRGGMLTLVSRSRLLLLKPIVVLRDYVNVTMRLPRLKPPIAQCLEHKMR